MAFLDDAKEFLRQKLNMKSLQDKLDENFENGIQVASSPLAFTGKKIGKYGPYERMQNGMVRYNSDPRAIIRNDFGVYPYDFLKSVEEPIRKEFNDVSNELWSRYKNGEISKEQFENDSRRLQDEYGKKIGDAVESSKESFNNAYNNIRDARDGLITEQHGDVMPSQNGAMIDSLSSQAFKRFIKNGNHLSDNKVADKQLFVDLQKAKKKSKEEGERLAKLFAQNKSVGNDREKSKYAELSGKYYTIKDKNGVDGGEIFYNKKDVQDRLDRNKILGYDGTIVEHNAKKALGGQNTQYLSGLLNKNSVQDIEQMSNSAKPIYYDNLGRPYVRGFTWTQTGNVPKITDNNGGYLASVGADTKEYHPHIVGHWTSEGWGNPMDKNYENDVKPGEVLSDGRNFDEQLLESRWPLNFYQKNPHINQGNNAERVVVMEAGKGSKDVHRPIFKVVDDKNKVRLWNERYNAANDRESEILSEYRERVKNGEDPQKVEDWAESELKKIHDDPLYIDAKQGLEKAIYGNLPSSEVPVGMLVNKIATPSRMITPHYEDNMPSDWSMRDRSNGGHTLPGFHPNKKWPSVNAESFANTIEDVSGVQRKQNESLFGHLKNTMSEQDYEKLWNDSKKGLRKKAFQTREGQEILKSAYRGNQFNSELGLGNMIRSISKQPKITEDELEQLRSAWRKKFKADSLDKVIGHKLGSNIGKYRESRGKYGLKEKYW